MGGLWRGRGFEGGRGGVGLGLGWAERGEGRGERGECVIKCTISVGAFGFGVWDWAIVFGGLG